jgi:hypothetical protein
MTKWWEDDSRWSESQYKGFFGRLDKVNQPEILEVLTRRAVVEALAVRQGLGHEALIGQWQAGGRDEMLAALQMEISISTDGVPQLKGDVQGVVSALQTPMENQSSDGEVPSLSEAGELLRSWNENWKQISLDDSSLKFAVCYDLCLYSFQQESNVANLDHQTYSAAYRPLHAGQQDGQRQDRF